MNYVREKIYHSTIFEETWHRNQHHNPIENSFVEYRNEGVSIIYNWNKFNLKNSKIIKETKKVTPLII
jgi:hypothetical protein